MSHIKAPPRPTDPAEAQRVQHSALRRRILYSEHLDDVRTRISESVGKTRANAWAIVDMTSNPAWYVTSQLSALYRETPEVSPPEGAEGAAAAIEESGFWQLAQRIQRDTIGMNDTFVRVDVSAETGEPSFRLIPPDLVRIVASPLHPSQPLAVVEWIPDPDNVGDWVSLECDPRSRLYRAKNSDGVDVTHRVLGAPNFSGPAYPFLVQGQPVLPYVAYHSAETGHALDPYSGREVFEGALQLGVYYSFFGHILRNAAWAQRWLLNAEPVGGDLDEDGKSQGTIQDPATALVLRQIEEAGGAGAQVGQFAPPVDPDKILGSIERYERRLVEMALSKVGVSRRDSDVRSAMSLAVSREAQREAQRAYEPIFRRSDLKLLRLVAGLRGEPTEGWSIRYRSLPRDAGELDSELGRIIKQVDSGLLDKVAAYQLLHPGLTSEEAEAAVQRITATNLRLSGATPVEVGGTDAPTAPTVAATPTINLTSTDIASIVTVDEARRSQGLPPIGGVEGALTINEFQARNANVIATAANAVAGSA